MKKILKHILISLSILPTFPVFAGGVYQEPADFINQVFNNAPPKVSVLWLKKDLKNQLAEILDHKYKGMRVRYWQQADTTPGKTVWILEEIGKDKLITAGIVINDDRIEQVKVLVFRESRGWEVRHDFFTDQFKQMELTANHQLSKNIDNISGATLSVRAVRKLAQMALILNKYIKPEVTQNDKP